MGAFFVYGGERGIDSKRDYSSRFDPFGAPERSKMRCILSNPAGDLWTFTLRHKQKRPPVKLGAFSVYGGERGIDSKT